MEILRLYPHIFAAISLVYWPMVWVQIWRLQKIAKRTGRSLCFTVSRNGHVRVRYMTDAPASPSRYRYDAPAVPVWDRPALASDLPQGMAGTVTSIPQTVITSTSATALRLDVAPLIPP